MILGFLILMIPFASVLAGAWLALGPCPSATYTQNCWDKKPGRWWLLALIAMHR